MEYLCKCVPKKNLITYVWACMPSKSSESLICRHICLLNHQRTHQTSLVLVFDPFPKERVQSSGVELFVVNWTKFGWLTIEGSAPKIILARVSFERRGGGRAVVNVQRQLRTKSQTRERPSCGSSLTHWTRLCLCKVELSCVSQKLLVANCICRTIIPDLPPFLDRWHVLILLITITTFIIMINVSTILVIIITILIIIMQSSSSSSSSTSSSSHLQMSRHLFLSSPHSSSPQVTKRNIMSKVYHPLRSTQIDSYNNTPHLNRLIGRHLHPPREGTKMFF